MVDVIGFLSFGLFTAHVTGNLVVIAAILVRGGPPKLAQILAVPVFMTAVAAAWGVAKALQSRGRAVLRPLLWLQVVLLAAALALAVVSDSNADPRGWAAGTIGMLAVSAMACQFTSLRLAMAHVPSTAVMTGNVTNTVLALLDTLFHGKPLLAGAPERLWRSVEVLLGFFAGCLAGALALSWLGEWAWLLPVALALAATALH